ncbi:MAG TPA: ABC transporter permease [Chloroflexota bacterium]|nr:ABC transporter permease [Chloroflexota bacterium]
MASPAAVWAPARSLPRRVLRLGLGHHQLWIGAIPLGVMVALAVIAPFFVPLQVIGTATPDLPPSVQHLMGTGTHSQEIFSEWIYAARYSLGIGFAAGLGTTILGAVIGITAGYVGGLLDDVISFVINLFLAVPPFPAIFVIAFSVGVVGAMPLVIVLTLTTWAYGAGLLRSQTISLKQREFVQSAVAVGERPWSAMWHELMPHLRGLVLFVLVGAVLIALQTEFGLEFLGWGVLADSNALGGGWGAMLFNAHFDNDFAAGIWWTWVFPGLGITLTSASLALISSGVIAATNPRESKP